MLRTSTSPRFRQAVRLAASIGLTCVLAYGPLKSASAQTVSGQLIDIGTINNGVGGKDYSVANGISDNGKITGQTTVPAAGFGGQTVARYRGFLWTPTQTNGTVQQSYIAISTLSTNVSQPYDESESIGYSVNDSGVVVGVSSFTPHPIVNGDVNGFRFQSGSGIQSIGTLTNGTNSGKDSICFGVNNSGHIIGASAYPSVPGDNRPNIGLPAPFLTVSGVKSDLVNLGTPSNIQYEAASGINNAGTVVGGPYYNATMWMWKPSVLGSVAGSRYDLGAPVGGISSFAYCISSDGRIGGSYNTADGRVHACVWTPSTSNGTSGSFAAEPALLPGCNDMAVKGINASGIAVGTCWYTDVNGVKSNYVAFQWNTNTGVVSSLNSLATSGASGLHLAEANGINDAGQVVGKATFVNSSSQTVTHAFLLTL